MASMTRTFVGLTIPDVQRTRLGRLQGVVSPGVPNTRWGTPEMFHVPLAFLGDVPDADVNAVCQAVAGASQDCKPFTLNLQSLGAFPDPKRPRVVWVGLTGPGLEALGALQQSIVRAV